MKKILVSIVFSMVAIVSIPVVGLAGSQVEVLAGVLSGTYRIREAQTQTHTVYLPAGNVDIQINGDGDSDLDLYVLDDHGTQLFAGESKTDKERVSLNLKYAGYYRIKVQNRGDVYNQYSLLVG